MRAAAYDREQDRLFLVEQAQARREIARRHAKLAQAVQSKAVARLQVPDPRELSPSELLRYIQVAAEIERRAVGEAPTAVTAEDQDQGADVAALTDEERRARMDQLRRELERRLSRARGEPGLGEAPGDREFRRSVGDVAGAVEGRGRRVGAR